LFFVLCSKVIVMSRERLPIIRASEVGEYVYCAHAWWLRRVAGLEPAGRERRELGTVLHRRHGQAVAGSRMLALVAALLIILSGR
jgi:CRISPR/Cas system-associated exonuclease Cas4 (RecB family)